MKKIPRQSKRLFISQLLWKKRLNQKCTPHAGYVGNGEDIHLVLGVNGAGIEHLTQLISLALPNNHYIFHPLKKFDPKLTLSTHGDRLAMPYHKELTADHPLNRAYRIYIEKSLVKTNKIFAQNKNEIFQNTLLIMKEVHALLATEALLRELKCRVLFYITDPVILADQIFTQEGLETFYLGLESEAVMDSRFLKRFFSRDLHAVLHAYKLIQRLSSGDKRRVQMKIFTITLIQHMFRMLAARYPELATVIDYSIIKDNPRQLGFPLVNWLGQGSLECSKHVIHTATFTPNGQKSSRWRRSWPESITAFEVLSPEDVSMAYQIIINHGLMSDEGNRKVWSKISIA
jgi:hypothetical protein